MTHNLHLNPTTEDALVLVTKARHEYHEAEKHLAQTKYQLQVAEDNWHHMRHEELKSFLESHLVEQIWSHNA